MSLTNSIDNMLSLNSPPTPAQPLPITISASDHTDDLTVPYAETPESATASNLSPAPTLITLLDFDHPALAPSHQVPGVRVEPEYGDGGDDDVVDEHGLRLVSGHRSPPFIQAPLPPIIHDLSGKSDLPLVRSPHPLPIRPRFAPISPNELALVLSPSIDTLALSAGHTRSPILAREQTALESFSRTLRTYVPSSIHIPRAAPSPPLVSRPVSFGSFSASRDASDTSHVGGAQSRQDEGAARLHARASSQPTTRSSGLAQALLYRQGTVDYAEYSGPAARGAMSYPGSEATHAEPIQWARWDKVNDRRLLILAYPSGFQIWDCTSLTSVSEVLNLNTSSPAWLGGGEIVHAAVLPAPSVQVVRSCDDPYAQDRPLLGVIVNSDSHRDSSTLFIYSLSRQFLIKQVALAGRAVTFESNALFLVISLTNPAMLQVHSATTLKEIYTISSHSLVSFAHNSPVTYSTLASKLFTTGTSNNNNKNNNNNNNEHVFLAGQGQGQGQDQQGNGPSPKPVFALSHRLLAFASPPSSSNARRGQRSPSGGSGHSSRASPSTSPFGIGGLSMQVTQAELGNAAIKVGGSLLSGMKTLGGMAFSAAKNHIMAGTHHEPSAHHNNADYYRRHPHPHSHSTGHRKYVSTSAPSGANLDPGDIRERRYSITSATSQDSTGRSYSGSEQAHPSPVLPNRPAGAEQGSYVTVVDLMPLLTGAAGPVTVTEWLTSRSQAVAGLHFSRDGCSILVVPQSGQTSQVYQLRPSPGVSRPVGGMATVGGGETGGGDHAKPVKEAAKETAVGGAEVMVRLYHLHRGRSQAIIDDVSWAHDGRWVAIGTRRPTIHVFAINPYGGKPDLRSHTKGKVMNVSELQPTSVEISPLVRLRAVNPPASDRVGTCLAFTFIDSSEACLPGSLLPASPAHLGGEPGNSPHHRTRPSNYQDLLVFDPNDGMLSLRRITTDLRAKDQGLSVAASVSMSALGATSASLPGLGGAGKLSTSPASITYSISAASNASSKQSNTDMNTTHDLIGKDAIMATWNLQRRRGWEEIRQPILSGTIQVTRAAAGGSHPNYLAYAELSTFSRSPRILPRSIYLSHQFTFYTLGEDYHALIRRSQLDIAGQKVEVRKEVEVSAFPSSHASESFIEGFAHTRDSRRFSASFDEPLANALAGGLEYMVAPPMLPMYPNGAPGSRPRTLRNSIPIRPIGDGMSEGLSRLRREINKVRSPHLLPRTGDSPSPGLVSLEFDEEDEDFLGRDTLDGFERGDEAAPEVIPVPEPGPSMEHLLIEDDGGGWDSQDRQAVEEQERFHDLVAPGLEDETFSGEEVVVYGQAPLDNVGGGIGSGGSGSGKKKKGKSRRR
ncbi:hypothetical protein APHAL10511_001481 [Amanita phalloides]|nr:hypothetical protein APHAL10511_001481 [Amanita phalloides]